MTGRGTTNRECLGQEGPGAPLRVQETRRVVSSTPPLHKAAFGTLLTFAVLCDSNLSQVAARLEALNR